MSRDEGLIRCILVAVRQNKGPLPPSTLEKRFSLYRDINEIRRSIHYLLGLGAIRLDENGDLIPHP